MGKLALLDKIALMLGDRPDFEFLDCERDEILQVVQLRRAWVSEILNPMGFNPVATEYWRYYGQAVVITVPRFTLKKEMVAEQKEMAHRYGKMGIEVIFADNLDSVIDRIGPVPDNFADYLARRPK